MSRSRCSFRFHARSIARELTKKFETYHRGTPKELLEWFEARTPEGEMFILMNGA